MSSPSRDDPASADRLNGWKEIAAYLGKSVSSVQRWERTLFLPIRRIKTPEGQIVSASKVEIDAWRHSLEATGQDLTAPEMDGSTAADPARGTAGIETRDRSIGATTVPSGGYVLSKRLILSISGFVTVAVVALFVLAGPTRRPSIVSMTVVGRSIEARGATGAVLWNYDVGTEVSRGRPELAAQPTDHRAAVVDLDHDGEPEHLIAVRFTLAHRSLGTRSDALFAFASDGRLLWQASPDTRVTCGGRTLGAPWMLLAVEVSTGPGPTRIWVSYAHNTFSPSFVYEIASGGQMSLRHLQMGWIMSLAEWRTPSGRWLAAGGVRHPQDQPALTLLDPDAPPSFAGGTDNSSSCEAAPSGRPDATVFFPNFDVAQAQDAAYLMVDRLKVVGSDLQVNLSNHAIVTLAPDLNASELIFSDSFFAAHRQLELTQRINHPAASCPSVSLDQEIRVLAADGIVRLQRLRYQGNVPRR